MKKHSSTPGSFSQPWLSQNELPFYKTVRFTLHKIPVLYNNRAFNSKIGFDWGKHIMVFVQNNNRLPKNPTRAHTQMLLPLHHLWLRPPPQWDHTLHLPAPGQQVNFWKNALPHTQSHRWKPTFPKSRVLGCFCSLLTPAVRAGGEGGGSLCRGKGDPHRNQGTVLDMTWSTLF